MTIEIPIPDLELSKLKKWVDKNDYSTLKYISVEEFLFELEERLALYQFALLSGGNCSPDPRWRKIYNSDSVIINTSKSLLLGKYPETAGISTIKKEYIEWYDLAASRANKHADTSQISTYGQTTYNQNVAKDEYLCSLKKDLEQVLVTVNLEEFTDSELTCQFACLIRDLRERLGIKEPPAPIKTRQLKSLGAFLHHYAIQYLDILIYCLIKPKPRDKTEEGNVMKEVCWTLTDALVANILNEYELDSDHIKGWRNQFYKKKLFNSDYMELFLEKTRSNPANLSKNMSDLI